MVRTLTFALATGVLLAALATELATRVFPGRPFALFLLCAASASLAAMATAVVTARATRQAVVPAADAPPSEAVGSAARESGVVKWFNRNKGFGFIVRDSGGEVFVHQNSLDESPRRALRDGEHVTFVVSHHKKGPQADQVRRAGIDP